MKTDTRFPLLMLAAFGWSAVAGADPESESAQLFTEIPPQFQLEDLRTAMGLNESTPTPEERAKAEKKIAELKPLLKKARAAIVVGSSVFDYPGLLAHNRPRYTDEHIVDGKTIGPAYTLYVGIYLLDHEGQGDYDFRVVFDEKGIVRSVEDVIWKR